MIRDGSPGLTLDLCAAKIFHLPHKPTCVSRTNSYLHFLPKSVNAMPRWRPPGNGDISEGLLAHDGFMGRKVYLLN